MCSRLWCRYLQLNTARASQQPGTEGRELESLLRVHRRGVSSSSPSQGRQKPRQAVIVFVIISAQRLGASCTWRLCTCCPPKCGCSLSLSSSRAAGPWLPSTASPGQSLPADSTLCSQSNTSMHKDTVQKENRAQDAY